MMTTWRYKLISPSPALLFVHVCHSMCGRGAGRPVGGVPDGVGHGHGMGLLPKDWPDNRLSTFSCAVRRLAVLVSHKAPLRRNRDGNINLTRASSSRKVQASSENRPLFFASRSQLLPRCARHRQVVEQWQRRAFGRRRLILGAQRRRPSPRRCSRRCFNAEKSPQHVDFHSLDGTGYTSSKELTVHASSEPGERGASQPRAWLAPP